MKTLKDLLMGMNDLAIPTKKKSDKVKGGEEVVEPKKKVSKNKKGETEPSTTFNYSQPGSEKATSSYTVSGTAPTFGNASATTTKTSAKKDTATKKGSKVTKKTPSRKKVTNQELNESFKTLFKEMKKIL
jgi:hypothetical protein